MKLVHLSDHHGRYRETAYQSADVVIHSGDALATGDWTEFSDFLDWFGEWPSPLKVYVPGNHDWSAQPCQAELEEQANRRGIEVLIDRGLTYRGVKLYGSPWVPYQPSWNWPAASCGFVATSETELSRLRGRIPLDVEILVTHGPARGMGDDLLPESYWLTVGEPQPGCPRLAERMARLKNLRLHLFGHIHDCPGTTELAGARFVNSAQVTTVLHLEDPHASS